MPEVKLVVTQKNECEYHYEQKLLAFLQFSVNQDSDARIKINDILMESPSRTVKPMVEILTEERELVVTEQHPFEYRYKTKLLVFLDPSDRQENEAFCLKRN